MPGVELISTTASIPFIPAVIGENDTREGSLQKTRSYSNMTTAFSGVEHGVGDAGFDV